MRKSHVENAYAGSYRSRFSQTLTNVSCATSRASSASPRSRLRNDEDAGRPPGDELGKGLGIAPRGATRERALFGGSSGRPERNHPRAGPLGRRLG